MLSGVCRDRYGSFPATVFNLWTCSMCYGYLFHTGGQLIPHPQKPWKLISFNSTFYNEGTVIIPDIENHTVTSDVCRSLSDTDCQRWKLCCTEAIQCCKRQLQQNAYNNDEIACPRTWDGYGCFDDTPAASYARIRCPSYIEHAQVTEMAYKQCTANGTWWQNPDTGSEWTNYTTCVTQIQDLRLVLYVGLVCKIVSLILLVPACCVFLSIRQLRQQQRIKLHLGLFLSLVLTASISLLWDMIVYRDRLDQRDSHLALMHRNTAGCKLLYILLRYSVTANYFWMVCEGFYLHRLIVNAFEFPKYLIGYHIFGWVVSWLPVVAYSSVRLTAAGLDKSCWVLHAGHYEWIIYSPSLVCIVTNTYFFAKILRILLTQIQTHPNEPSSYRRALRATFVLVPLFGIQCVFLIYRPSIGESGHLVYEVASHIIRDTQGGIISLIFCFCNGEVYSHLKTWALRHRYGSTRSDTYRKNSMTATQYSIVVPSTRRTIRPIENNPNYIPLSPIDTENIGPFNINCQYF